MDGIKARITLRLIEATSIPGEGELRIWDSEARGFMLRVASSGRRTYCLKYRHLNRQRWLTIGEHGSPWTPETARARARDALYQVAHGEDPQVVKEERRARNATISELFERYFVEGRIDKPLKRDSSWAVDRTNYTRHIEPLLGARIAAEVTVSDLSKWQADVVAGKTSLDVKTRKRGRAIVTGGTGAAARSMRTLSAMITWAVRHEVLERNPCTKVQKHRDQQRERALSEAEARRLWTMIDEAEAASVITSDFAKIIRLIMLTGARRNEIVELRWSEVDLDRARLVLPPVRTKMGALNRPRHIVLSEAALAILHRVKRRGAHVFPSSADKPLTGVNRAWEKVRTLAGIEDVRLHDLRHSFATFAVENGASLFQVGRTLGHAKAASTERYAHPSDASARSIASDVAARFLPRANVEAIPSGEAQPLLPLDLPALDSKNLSA
jgi:integrase